MSSFGSVSFKGKVYDHDIIIHANGMITKREKKLSKEMKKEFGHTPLSESELEFLENENPDIIYIATGYIKAMPLTSMAKSILERYIYLIDSTDSIMNIIANEKRKFVAIIHVTC